MQTVFYKVASLFTIIAVAWREWPGLSYYINVHRDFERLRQR